MSKVARKSNRSCEICGLKEAHQNIHSFFAKFPLDEVRCREWVRITGNEDLVHLPIEKLNQLKHVCGDHFEKKYFNKKGNRLKSQSIPTLKLISVPLNDIQLAEFPQHMDKSRVPQEINQLEVIKPEKPVIENIKQNARRLMLKESGSLIKRGAVGGAGTNAGVVTGGGRSKGVVVRATPVRSPPPPGVKMFALHNKLAVSWQEGKSVHMTEVKSTTGPKATTLVAKARAPAVKIIMNKASFNRLLVTQPNQKASQLVSQQVIHQASQQLPVSDMKVETVSETVESVSVLRAQLYAAQAIRELQAVQANIRELQAKLNTTRERLAQYEPPDP